MRESRTRLDGVPTRSQLQIPVYWFRYVFANCRFGNSTGDPQKATVAVSVIGPRISF